MTQSEGNEWQTSFLFRLAGYGLLLLVLFELVDIFFPPQFMDPVWEFQTIGAVVERVPLPLLGFVLIFYGAWSFRSRWEVTLLKVLSWAALLIGVFLLLLIPLAVSNTLRINARNNTELTTQTAQQLTQLQQFQEQLGQATANDLESLLARVNTQNGSPAIKNSQELKSRLLAEADQAQKTLKTQAETTRREKRTALLKSSFKWNVGALISGILFIRVWQATRWAR